ncbi:hypothetical protein [Kineococcus auxinigenes]|uniref:hypothetical protein n=1 Tax=unclassified Kineococcus TaxID=2621656 RepID=UPI003D7CFC10
MEQTWEPAASTLGVITGLPLPAAVQNLLMSLQPPQPQEHRRSRRGSTGARSLLEQGQPQRPDELDPTTLQRLPAVGAVHLHAADGRPLQPLWIGATAPAVRATPGDVAAGRSPRQVAERSPVLGLLLVPAAVELVGLMRVEIPSRGITQITWSLRSSAPTPPPETARRRLSGDWTLVDVRGHLVGVSYASTAGTTLSWQGRRVGMACSVTMQTPVDPVLAVQRLAQDTLLLPATARA